MKTTVAATRGTRTKSILDHKSSTYIFISLTNLKTDKGMKIIEFVKMIDIVSDIYFKYKSVSINEMKVFENPC